MVLGIPRLDAGEGKFNKEVVKCLVTLVNKRRIEHEK